MLCCDVAAGLGVVLLYVVDKRVGTLQVEPALELTAELDGTLTQDGLDVGVRLTVDGLQAVVLA